MRLITRHKLYRAFPELDSYEDGQCEQFLAAAQGGWVRWGLRWAVCAGMAGVLALVLAWLVAILIVVPGRVPKWGGWEVLPSLVTGAMVWPLGAIMLRDVLVRLRVRRVLRVTGSCSVCGYSLIGMPLDAEHRVTCPECGNVKAVDPSLAVLTKDEAGRTRIESITQAPELPAFWTAKRWRLFKRLALAAVLVFVVLPGVLFGVYELFLRWQAGEARAARVPVEKLMAIVESAQPEGAGPGMPDAWEAFDRADAIARRIDAGILAADEFRNARGEAVRPDFTYLYEPRPKRDESAEVDGNVDAEADAEREIATRAARRALEQYQGAGVFEELREMAARRRAVRMPVLDPSGKSDALYSRLLPWLGRTRYFARANAARMKLAGEAGDGVTYVEALDQMLALAQMNVRRGTALELMVGSALDALAMRRAHEFVPSCIDDTWLAGMDGVIASRPLDLDVARVIEVERLAGLDFVADVFSEPKRVRFGRFSPALESYLGYPIRSRVGTYRENVREVNEYYNDCAGIVAGNGPATPRTPTALGELVLWALPREIDRSRLAATAHDGLRLVIALRRFELREKRLPESLDELVPTYLPAIPSDPLGTGPYKLRRIDPAKDRLQRSYLIYSVGLDGIDDQGLEFNGPQKTSRETPGVSTGTDRVFNSDW